MSKNPNDKPEFQRQAELRAARKKSKKRTQSRSRERAPLDTSEGTLVLVTTHPGVAYEALRTSETTQTYWPLFRKHFKRQQACMMRSLVFNGPKVVLDKVERELSRGGAWRRGKLAPRAEQLEMKP